MPYVSGVSFRKESNPTEDILNLRFLLLVH